MSQLELLKNVKIVSPWSSKGLINRAGDAFRSDKTPGEQELKALETWRAAHKNVLNTFQAILRTRAEGLGIQLARGRKTPRRTMNIEFVREEV